MKNLLIILMPFILIIGCEKENNNKETEGDERNTGLQFTPTIIYNSIPINSIGAYTGVFPSSFQLDFPPIAYQGSEGSCVSFAATYAIMSHYMGGDFGTLSNINYDGVASPEFTYNQTVYDHSDCTNSGSNFLTNGSKIGILDLLKTKGTCTWSQMPYSYTNGCSQMPNSTQLSQAEDNKIIKYERVTDFTTSNVKSLLLQDKPILFGCIVDASFSTVSSSFIWRNAYTSGGGHAMVIIGYDDAKGAFKIQNSWGQTWCDNGYCWMDYNSVASILREAYILYPNITTPGTVSDTFTDPRDNTKYPIIKIGNQYWFGKDLVYDAPGFLDLGYFSNIDSIKKYGRYYRWDVAVGGASVNSNSVPSGIQGVCPDGWHIPSQAEYNILLNNFPNGFSAYDELIYGGGTRFNASLDGFFYASNNSFSYTGTFAYYNSTTKSGTTGYYPFRLWGVIGKAESGQDLNIDNQYSKCRCLKN